MTNGYFEIDKVINDDYNVLYKVVNDDELME